MNKLLLILAICLSIEARATETDKAAHFGVSYAFNTAMYGLSKKAFRLERKDAMIFAAFTTIVLSTAAEYMGGPGSRVDGGDIKANILGTAASSVTILMFDF
ncbi:hypothetical protein EBZ38_03450 [bacterium]|nr:hypothetical protein [bacterium]NDC94018.1 hypothetical protein [bacterium]NDD83323.1 hypothetical protein [bacterium]